MAFLMGLIQGITSVLPLSSSGHIALIGQLTGQTGAVSLHFMTILHIGTLLAIIWTFWNELYKLFLAFVGILVRSLANVPVLFRNLGNPSKGHYYPVVRGNYSKLMVMMLLAAAVELPVSLILRRFAFTGAGSLIFTAMGFFIMALLFMVSSFTIPSKRSPRTANYKDAFMGGLFQGFAALPGLSRLGCAFSAGSLCGFKGPLRMKTAYLMAVPAIIGGLIFVLPSPQVSFEAPAGVPACIVGVAVSTVTSVFVLRFARRILVRSSGRGFAIYSLIIGVVCIIASFR